MPDSIKPIDKSNLPSRHVSIGPEKAPHRSYYYAMGMTEEEIIKYGSWIEVFEIVFESFKSK